ncbi:MAG: hypothetical protein KKA55_09685 [Proteobacteria bacterium]|nr:hypothetical protein [Pseudomonadota bacterium]MBU1595787.1 hypothetical protein [Pseudomonadota bacterium]
MPKGWLPPTERQGGLLAGVSLLRGGGESLLRFVQPEGERGGGSGPDADGDPGGGAGPGPGGGHTKIGAGRKPQAYDERGRYTGPGGGSYSFRDGVIRLHESFGQDDEQEQDDEPENGPEDGESGEEDTGGEPRAETEDEASRELEGILVADSGRVVSDAGGGLSGGPEVRGPAAKEVRDPVPPPQKAPAEVAWENDKANRGPTHEQLEPQTREAVENLRKNNPQLESINVNSGKRDGTGPHAEGRAVDINKVNGIPVKDLADPKTPEAERAQQAAKNMAEQAKKDDNVNQVLGPTGCWKKVDGDWKQYDQSDPRNTGLIKGHQDHYHINVFRK